MDEGTVDQSVILTTGRLELPKPARQHQWRTVRTKGRETTHERMSHRLDSTMRRIEQMERREANRRRVMATREEMGRGPRSEDDN